VGVAIDDQPKAAHEKGVPVQLTPMGGRSSQEDQANVIAARQSPGFLVARELVADVLAHRADRVMLDYNREAVAVRYMIDGVWHELPSREREDADVMLAVLKKISALDMNERRARQQGRFGAEAQGHMYVAQLVSQGTQTGERVTLQLVDQSAARFTLETVGMREKMQEQLKQHLAAKKGFLLLSAMPSGGLTTTLLAALNATDRFMRNFVALQDKGSPDPMADNVDLETYDAAAGEAPDARLARILRSEPNVIVMPELPDAATVKLLCDHARSDLLVVGTIRAKEAVEALLRVLLLKVPAKDFAPAATAVLNQRLIRKLCPACRQAYAPPPELLAKLGIPAGRVEAFYRPPVPGDAKERDRDEACPECRGLGYLGRTAVFELLQVSDPLREALVKQPKLELLRQIVRKTGHRSLQEEGIVLVARGVTSLAELSRVLKQ
jgi:type II secretory ATPase GspE/PulE/Tfp pilus assembly ATPase PilB-like protein